MKFENHYTHPDGFKCSQCRNTNVTAHVVDEINGMAVGPYNVVECEECGFEWVTEESIDDPSE